ncbi:MAG: ABC transporter substrate-binding protein [Proteobacteria bacterium]|nr:ABC transporter substrate-binding protein [Pseudomonadota bacterium]
MTKNALYALLAATLGFAGCGKDKSEGGEGESAALTKASNEPTAPVEIAISCGAVGKELQLCKTGAAAWGKKTGAKVKVVSTPNEASERLNLYQTNLAAKSSNIDVFQIDVIWPGILANHMIDLKPYTKGAENDHFKAIIENNTVKGKLVGMPWFTDAGVLYYRKDLLEKHGEKPPTTWDELTTTAKKVMDAERKAGNDKMWGFVWQGKAYEGLTCDALEWVASYGGGSIVDSSGKVTINNPKAAAAIDMAAGWINEVKITPQDVLNGAEEEARGVFQSGNAVFMRNWPYAWALAQDADSPVAGKVAVVALPKGPSGRSAAVLGGWQLAVSKYSKHPELAADLVMFLTGAEEQKRRAIEGAYNPTIGSLYQDADILKATPFFGSLYDTFLNAQPRPSTVTGTKYNRVSVEFFNAVHEVLSGKSKAADSLAALESKLKAVSKGGRW